MKDKAVEHMQPPVDDEVQISLHFSKRSVLLSLDPTFTRQTVLLYAFRSKARWRERT